MLLLLQLVGNYAIIISVTMMTTTTMMMITMTTLIRFCIIFEFFASPDVEREATMFSTKKPFYLDIEKVEISSE